MSAGPPIIVRTYRGNQASATHQYQIDAQQMAAHGYYPTSQSWAEGQWGCGAFLIAILLFLFLIGILIFIYMILVKPDGTLTVTYSQRPQQGGWGWGWG
jgi:hypothetical protein